MSHVLTKSAKGLREASGKTQELPDELREVLKLCRGQFVAEELVADAPPEAQEALASALVVLTETGYLREVIEIDTESLTTTGGTSGQLVLLGPDAMELDGGQSDGLAQQLRAEVAARRGQRDGEASEQVRQADTLARQRAVEKSKKEAEERARIEAEERAKREAEARARIEAEEKKRLEALERERAEAEENARREAAERTRRAAEEKARKEAAERAKRDAEERARRETEERELEEMRERIRQRGIKRRRVAIPLVVALIVVPAALIWGVGLISFDGKRMEFEARATQMLEVPVKIAAAHFVLVPRPQWQLEQVVVGGGNQAVRINRADVNASISSLWGLPESFSVVHLDSPSLPLMALPLLFGEGALALNLPVGEITGSGLALLGANPPAPPMAFTATMSSGKFSSFAATGQSPESGKFAMTAEPVSGSWQVEIQASQCQVPFGFNRALTDCVLKARFAPTAMTISRFTGRMYNGELTIAGLLSWTGPWQSSGTIEMKLLDASQWAPGWFKDGFVSGAGEFASSAGQADELLAGFRLAGKFSMAPGTLNQVDLDRVVQGRGNGEQSRFASLEGNVLFEQGRTDISGLALVAGPLHADGNISIDAAQAVSGRLALEVKTGGMRVAAPVAVSGTLAKPVYQR